MLFRWACCVVILFVAVKCLQVHAAKLAPRCESASTQKCNDMMLKNPKQNKPVCGSDGFWYANSCHLKCASAKKRSITPASDMSPCVRGRTTWGLWGLDDDADDTEEQSDS